LLKAVTSQQFPEGDKTEYIRQYPVWLFVNINATIRPSQEYLDILLSGFVMSIVAPKERKPLSADALFHLVRSGLARFPDYRPGDTAIA
jgi:hypothetical protein